MATVAVLIRLKTNTHPDATKNVRGCYKRGDTVIAKEDDGTWTPGTKEVPPDFAWLYLTSVSLAKVERFIFEEHDTADGVRTATSRCVRRRLYRLEADSLPAAARNLALTLRPWPSAPGVQTGYLWIGAGGDYTWNQVRAYIRNKKSNQTEADIGTTAGDLA